MSTQRVPYAGIATRALALAMDILIVHVVVLTGAAILALVASLVGDLKLDTTLERVVCAVAWAATVAVYFVVFWSTTGQTPAMRLMELRVVAEDGEPPHVVRAFVRLIGLVLAIIPCFLGFVPVLVDDRRRALQDLLAGTVVVHSDDAGGLALPVSARAP